jgi:hypothetical protein
MFTASSARSTRDSISSRSRPRFSGPKATSLPTVAATSWSRGSWKTIPTADRAATRSSPTGRPSTRTSPSSGDRRPLKCRTRVDFPEPFGPTSRRNSPSGIVTETPSIATVSP